MDEVTKKNQEQYDIHAEEWSTAMDGNFAHKYLEKPAMEAELPENLFGKKVLCIGVGSGEELELIIERHPQGIVAIDISTELLKIARSHFPSVEFIKMEMTDLNFPDESFDYVYSSLVFHYAPDWDKLLAGVFRVLKNKGELIFSTHHPDYWSGKSPTGNTVTNSRGITLTEHTASLPGNVGIIYYNHSNINSIKEAVRYAGFKVLKAYAPMVTEISTDHLSVSDMDKYHKLKEKNDKTPLFFIIKAIKE